LSGPFVSIGKTGFESATARPPAGAIQAYPPLLGVVEAFELVGGAQLGSIWTTYWTPSTPPDRSSRRAWRAALGKSPGDRPGSAGPTCDRLAPATATVSGEGAMESQPE
jgi:hypothetical protein